LCRLQSIDCRGCNLFVNVLSTQYALAVRNNQVGDRDLRRTAVSPWDWDCDCDCGTGTLEIDARNESRTTTTTTGLIGWRCGHIHHILRCLLRIYALAMSVYMSSVVGLRFTDSTLASARDKMHCILCKQDSCRDSGTIVCTSGITTVL